MICVEHVVLHSNGVEHVVLHSNSVEHVVLHSNSVERVVLHSNSGGLNPSYIYMKLEVKTKISLCMAIMLHHPWRSLLHTVLCDRSHALFYTTCVCVCARVILHRTDQC